MSFIARFWPYIAIVLALIALWVLHEHDQARYGMLKTEYATYRAQVADANLVAQKAAREALEGQIAERAKIDKHNAEVLSDYAKTTAAITADRDRSRELVRRLLASHPSGGASSGGRMPEADHRSGAADTGSSGSDDRLGELLVAAREECLRNAAQLNALVSQIGPQL